MAKNITVIPATIEKHTRMVMGQRRRRRVAGYARVSTDSEEQLTSYEAQVDYYTHYIQGNPDWQFVKVYTDVYNQRLIPFDTKMAVQTPKIKAFEGKSACRKPLFLFYALMRFGRWVH